MPRVVNLDLIFKSLEPIAVIFLLFILPIIEFGLFHMGKLESDYACWNSLVFTFISVVSGIGLGNLAAKSYLYNIDKAISERIMDNECSEHFCFCCEPLEFNSIGKYGFLMYMALIGSLVNVGISWAIPVSTLVRWCSMGPFIVLIPAIAVGYSYERNLANSCKPRYLADLKAIHGLTA